MVVRAEGVRSPDPWVLREEGPGVCVQVCLTVFVLDFLLEMWKVMVSSPMKMYETP